MSNLVKDTAWTGTITLTKSSGTKITLPTSGTYLDRNIELTVNAPTYPNAEDNLF